MDARRNISDLGQALSVGFSLTSRQFAGGCGWYCVKRIKVSPMWKKTWAKVLSRLYKSSDQINVCLILLLGSSNVCVSTYRHLLFFTDDINVHTTHRSRGSFWKQPLHFLDEGKAVCILPSPDPAIYWHVWLVGISQCSQLIIKYHPTFSWGESWNTMGPLSILHWKQLKC